MPRLLLPLRHLLLASATAGALAACSSTVDPSAIAGNYQATTLRVTPTGQGESDVLAAGGTLLLTVAPNNATSGTLTIPAALTGGTSPFIYDLTGKAVQTGSTVQFQVSSNAFIGSLTFTVNGTALEAINQTVNAQTAGEANFTVVLTRQ